MLSSITDVSFSYTLIFVEVDPGLMISSFQIFDESLMCVTSECMNLSCTHFTRGRAGWQAETGFPILIITEFFHARYDILVLNWKNRNPMLK